MSELKWWQKAVFYQIYPRSFADGNGDGIGDFHGLIQKLDYLKELGIDALWISPCYPSPQFDVGYDVADYTDINPEYGTLEDFRRFLKGAHERGFRVILDFVPNHSSDQHPWFLASRSSRDNPKRDWYIWRDPRLGTTVPLSPSLAERGTADDGNSPPNNWNAGFLSSAWTYDAQTGQYYYHYFFPQQPDLNWRNPELKEAMWNAVRFWLDLGVDGFRLDAIGTIFEDPDLPDQPVPMSLMNLYGESMAAKTEEERKQVGEKFQAMFQYQVELPEVLDLMKELRRVMDEYDDRMLVGENEDIRYMGNGNDALHMVFNFPLMNVEQLTPAHVRANQKKRLTEMPSGGWPCNTLNNHDSPRIYSRYRPEGEPPQRTPQRDAMSRVYLALMLTLRGTPFLYNGEEIGMIDLLLTDSAQFRDNLSGLVYAGLTGEFGLSAEFALPPAALFGRDKNRTPMQWDNAPNAGFSGTVVPSPLGVQTWLPMNPDYAQGINVAEQEKDPASLLNFYKRMLRFRKQTPALIAGDYTPLDEQAEDYLAFLRRDAESGQTCLVVLNFSEKAHTLNLDVPSSASRCLFSSRSRPSETEDLSQLEIAPFEIYIGEI